MITYKVINKSNITLPLWSTVNKTVVIVYVATQPNFNIIPDKLRFPTREENATEIVILRDPRRTLIIFYLSSLSKGFLEKPYETEIKLILQALNRSKIIRDMLNSNCTIEEIDIYRLGNKSQVAFVYIRCTELRGYRIVTTVNLISCRVNRITLVPRDN